MQYIGARYVPKFMGAYDVTQEYEALCVVDNGLGTSYITKIPTPAGTPLTDTTHWALYGASSGAVINLQNQIDAMDLRVDGLETGLLWTTPEAFNAAGDGVTDDSQAFIDCVDYAKTNKCAIMLRNSYYITQKIELFSGCMIVGSNCTINIDYVDPSTTSYDWFCFDVSNCNNVRITGCNFVGTGADTSIYTHCIFVGGAYASNITIDHCSFKDIQAEGAIIFFESHDIDVSYCKIVDYTFTGITFGDYTYNATASHNTILNGHITGTGHVDRYPISICGFSYILSNWNRPMPSNLAALYNYIEDDAAEWEGIDAHGGNHIRVIGNVVKNTAIPIAIFSDDNRYFKVTDAIISDNLTIQEDNKMPSGKQFYASAFSGLQMVVSNNQFKMFWTSTPSSQSLSDYFGVSVGGRVEFSNNVCIDLPNCVVALGNYPGAVDINSNNFRSTISTLENNSYLIGFTDSTSLITAQVRNNNVDYLHPYNEFAVHANSIAVFEDNEYGQITYLLSWGTGSHFIPDYCTAAELPTIRVPGHVVHNQDPASGQPVGWIGVRGSGWVAVANL